MPESDLQEAQNWDAFDLVIEILRRATTDHPAFPPTELYSEGWMLRLLLHASTTGKGGMPFQLAADADWYSEARLTSAFLPRFRGDPLGEGLTHVDGVVGHFGFREGTTAGFALLSDATQFVVLEAKMGSGLASGTSRVPWFDQATRNVAAMAWTIHESTIPIDQWDHLSFLVIAPQERLQADRSFRALTDPGGIMDRIRRRIDLYQDEPHRRRLERFYAKTAEPFMDKLLLHVASWEELIRSVADDWQPGLQRFYADCLTYNLPRRG